MVLQKVKNWYARFERPISSLSLIGGFVFDAVTLHRVDQFWENLWVVGHILIVATCMILVHRLHGDEGDEGNPDKVRFWLVNTIQFFFGGILSTFLVFYFRSSLLLVSWPFILILVIAFIANERFKRAFVRLSFQISLLYLSLLCFATFIVPVIVHSIGTGVFILSGAISLGAMAIFLLILFHANPVLFRNNKRIIFMPILSILVVFNVLYFTNTIPPLPLSLKDAGMYHSIYRDAAGDYIGTYEQYGWRGFFTLYDDFHASSSAPVYAYSAVFSPTALNLTIVHEWQHYDESAGKWVTESIVNLPVVGGRDGGFRTYSARANLAAGFWRVNVKTTNGEVLGRMWFTMVPGTTPVNLTSKTN